MKKILAIGNSFSEDATRYLHKIAEADGSASKIANLIIGGCPLEKHFRNLCGNLPAYSFTFNGESTGLSVSIQTMLLSDNWDYITLQQVSHQAPYYNIYQPYLSEIAKKIRYYQPKAKLIIHQTWAYEENSKRLTEELHYASAAEMYRDIQSAYTKAAQEIHADGIIPSGTLFQKLQESDFSHIHRDTFHASLGLGRYAIGLLWYDLLFGKTVIGNQFRLLDEVDPTMDFNKIQKIVHDVADLYRF